MNEQTVADRIAELQDERAALNELMATFQDERKAHNYDRRDYIDTRIRALREREEDAA